jgi:hypothetical protein
MLRGGRAVGQGRCCDEGAALRACIAMVLAYWLLTSCVPMPTQPDGDGQGILPGGLYVLCEGLWRQNNTVLSYVMPSAGTSIRDVLARTSPGITLGDTGNDMVAMGDTLVVAMNTSRSIELLLRSSGRWLASIPMPLGKEPYRICVVSDSTVLVTNLNDDSMTEIDIRSRTVRIATVPTGPAPEGIATDGVVVAVANSGLGDLRYTEENAGTVYVYQRSDLQQIRTLRGLPNVGSVTFDRLRRILWVTYRNRLSLADSLGGVVAYDTRSWATAGHWRVASPGRLQVTGSGQVHVLCADGVRQYSLGDTASTVVVPWHGTGVWYGMWVIKSRLPSTLPTLASLLPTAW